MNLDLQKVKVELLGMSEGRSVFQNGKPGDSAIVEGKYDRLLSCFFSVRSYIIDTLLDVLQSRGRLLLVNSLTLRPSSRAWRPVLPFLRLTTNPPSPTRKRPQHQHNHCYERQHEVIDPSSHPMTTSRPSLGPRSKSKDLYLIETPHRKYLHTPTTAKRRQLNPRSPPLRVQGVVRTHSAPRR